MYTEEEQAQLAVSRERRDVQFWDRVRAKGLNAYFELGGRLIPDHKKDELLQRLNAQREDVIAIREWIESTGTLPPVGNRTAAQLLGFKLRYYASRFRDATDILPDNLIYLAALLIKIGFISLRDLYPHLYPPDEKMPEVKEKLMKEKAERERKNRSGGGAMNALAMAGALVDDTLPTHSVSRLRESEANRATPSRTDQTAEKANTPAKEEAEAQEELPEPVDQKIHLLRSLLCIGAIPESLYILGRFPWLMDVHSDLPAHIHRMLHHSLEKVYSSLRQEERRTLRDPKKFPIEESSGTKGTAATIEPPARKTLRWAKLDREGSGEGGTDYRFYWDDWADNVPICQNINDVFTLCGSLLNVSGLKIGLDPLLMTKLARIGHQSLTQDTSEANMTRWIELAKRLLVPALSVTKDNPAVVEEVWGLLKLFNTKTRFNIYAEWYKGPTSRLPDVKAAFDQTRAETKDVLKRISKTNIKPMARKLAKAALMSPGIVFDVALNQIESYNNLIDVFVKCSRYLTFLGYDILTWSLLEAIGGGSRQRTAADGMVTSKWLQALAVFSGTVYRSYQTMNCAPILQYLNHQLYRGVSADLEVLEQMLVSMAGVKPDVNFNDAQTWAMAGGEVLHGLILNQILDKRHESRSTSRRLINALQDTKLAAPLLIALAQEYQQYPFHPDIADAPAKVVGENNDKIYRVFVQYLEVLRYNLKPKDFDALIPDLFTLVSEFHLRPDAAFAICRPSLSLEIATVDNARKIEENLKRSSNTTPEGPKPNGEHNNAENGIKKLLNGNSPPSTAAISPEGGPVLPAGDSTDIVMKDATLPETKASIKQEDSMEIDMEESASAISKNGADGLWHPILAPHIQCIKSSLPDNFENVQSVGFYVTFWQLSLADIYVPTSSYDDEMKRVRRDVAQVAADRSDLSAFGVRRKEAEKKRLTEMETQLANELKTRIQVNSLVRGRLLKEKDHWFFEFPMIKKDKRGVVNALWERCFLPRIQLSSVDAFYTFKFLLYLHSSGAKGFHTFTALDWIFHENVIPRLMGTWTTREAENVGRFLNLLLTELKAWHADETKYEQAAYGRRRELPGFARKFSAPNNDPIQFIDYEDFRRLLHKWHKNLLITFEACLGSDDYMQIYNSLKLLSAVAPNFPSVLWQGKRLMEAVKSLTTSTRKDVEVAAKSLHGQLVRRQSTWLHHETFMKVRAVRSHP